MSIDGRAPTPKELKDYMKAMAEAMAPNYGRLARYFEARAQRVVKGERTAYRAIARRSCPRAR